MPQLAFANSFWESYDVLEKPVKAGVRKAMQKFQQLTVAELHADKELHLESVEKPRDPRMRTIRINDFWRGVVLAPDDGSDVFLLVNVVAHDVAYNWAAKRLYTTNSATRALEVRNVVAIEQLPPLLRRPRLRPLPCSSPGTPTRRFTTWGSTTRCCGPYAPSSTNRSWRRSRRCCPRTSSRCSSTSPRASTPTTSTGTSSPHDDRRHRCPPRTTASPWSSPIPEPASPWSPDPKS